MIEYIAEGFLFRDIIAKKEGVMSWKMFGQIVLLMIVGALILMLMKCAIMQCPIMRKSIKCYPSSAACLSSLKN